MRYIQKVEIDCSDIKKVKSEFNNILFLKHLTKLLPVKIIEWDGTYDGAKAHLAFWFLAGEISLLIIKKIVKIRLVFLL